MFTTDNRQCSVSLLNDRMEMVRVREGGIKITRGGASLGAKGDKPHLILL
jgi:hypothetical protein